MNNIKSVKQKAKIKRYLFIKKIKLRLHIIKNFFKSKNKLKILKNSALKKKNNIINRYKNSTNRFAFVLNSILSSRITIILLFFILMFKSNLFYTNIELPEDSMDRTNLMTARFLSVMICPLLFIRKDKNRFRWVMFYDIFLSILLFVDNVYFAYSSNLLSISQILYVRYAEEIRRHTTIFVGIKSSVILYRYSGINYSLAYCKK